MVLIISCGIMLLTGRQHVLPPQRDKELDTHNHYLSVYCCLPNKETFQLLEVRPVLRVSHHPSPPRCFIRLLVRFKKDRKLCRGLSQLLYRLGISHLLAHVQQSSGGRCSSSACVCVVAAKADRNSKISPGPF